jgi:hypothetical protein
MGHVFDPDTQAPIDSVRVTLVWTDVEVGKNIGFRRLAKVRESYTNSAGMFMICGVPAGVHGTLQAELGEAKTAEVQVDMGNALLATEALFLSRLVPTDSTTLLVGDASVSGRVVNDKGVPVPNAEVSVHGAKSKTKTQSDGEFLLTNLPSGTRAVLVRRIGYSPVEMAVDLTPQEPARIMVRLAAAAPRLDEVKVEGKMTAALKKNGFLDRKKMGMGRFLGPEDLARRQPQYFSSIFQTIPGFRLEQGAYGSSIKSTRGNNGCVTIWIDGVQWRESQTGELDQSLPVDQVMAVETYSSSSAPMEFQSAGQTACAVVVVWTNRTVRR